MSSILETGNNKAKCQKFTPDTLVETMLNLAGYTTDLMGKTTWKTHLELETSLRLLLIDILRAQLYQDIVKKLFL